LITAAQYPTSVLRACSRLALACGAILLMPMPGQGGAAVEEPNEASVVGRLGAGLDRLLAPRCLTPAVSGALADLVATGALQPALRGDFTLEEMAVSADHIEVEIRDQARRSYGITLAFPGSRGGRPDGEGRHFSFYLAASPPSPNPRASTVLLTAAALFDQAIPEAALRCAGADEVHRDEDRRYPRALALASGIAQVSVVLAAILFGLRVVRSHDGGAGAGAPRPGVGGTG
jgi:hypothetical protein